MYSPDQLKALKPDAVKLGQLLALLVQLPDILDSLDEGYALAAKIDELRAQQAAAQSETDRFVTLKAEKEAEYNAWEEAKRAEVGKAVDDYIAKVKADR